LNVASTRGACRGKFKVMLADSPSALVRDSVGPSRLLWCRAICAGATDGNCRCIGEPSKPSALGGVWCPKVSFQLSPSIRKRAGRASRSSHSAGLSSSSVFRPSWRGLRRGSRRASRRSRSMLSPKVRCSVPLGLPSHSRPSSNAGPSARNVNDGGTPSAAQNGEVRSSSGRRGSGGPIWPCAAPSASRKADQSWPLLLTGNGGDLSRPVPGDCLIPSCPAGPPGKGGTMVPRRMVPARVWIPKRASCSPPSVSCTELRPDTMPGSARGPALLSLKQDF
jgi:hypothetical protein